MTLSDEIDLQHGLIDDAAAEMQRLKSTDERLAHQQLMLVYWMGVLVNEYAALPADDYDA